MTNFTFNGKSMKLSTSSATPTNLAKIFKLDPKSIKLIGSEFIRQEDGKFSSIISGEKTYEVLGDVQQIVAKVPTSHQLILSKEDIADLNNKVLNQTGDMSNNLDGVAQAPKAVSLINTLTILAACMNDFSLDHPQTKNSIKLLRTPGSFKASLVQVVYEATMAFVNADSSASQIKMELAMIPNAIFDSIKTASQTDNPGAKKILEVNKVCAEQAEGITKQLEGVQELIMELVEAAIATLGLNEEQQKEVEKKINEIKEKKKHAEKESQRVQEEISKQERRTKEAREEYKKKSHVESEKLNAAIGVMEQMGREDELNKEAANWRQEIAALSASLNTANVEKLDLNEIIEYLSKGLVILSSLQETWLEQTKFFRDVADIVSGPLKDTLMEFIEHQNDAVESPQSIMLRKKLLETAMTGCGICYQVMKCSDIYQEISTKYVIPKIAKATENLRLSKGDAQLQLLNTENEYAKTEKELRRLIKLRKAEMITKTENEISSYIKQLAIIE